MRPVGRWLAMLLLPLALPGAAVPVPAGPLYAEVSSAAALVKTAARIGAEGGTIRLRPGVYTLTHALRFERVNHVNLIGSGWNTTLQTRGSINAIELADCGFCTVRDLLIGGDGAAKSGSGIVFGGQSSSCTVDFCRISGFAVSGIRFEGTAKTPQSSSTVSRCHFIDNGGDQLYSANNNDFHILNNQFGAHQRSGAKAPRSGACLWPSSAGTYSGNYHWGNRVALRLGPGSNFNRIENNRFEESLEQGVLLGDPLTAGGLYLNILTGNTIHTNSMRTSGAFAAVEAYGACDVTFTSNQVFSWDSGVYRHRSSVVIGRGCKSWIVKDNVLRHNTGPALVYGQAAGHVVKDNVQD